MKTKMVPAMMLPIAAFMAFTVNAATNPATSTFMVQMTINKACTVTAGNNIALGANDATATNVTGNSSFTVTCSKTTPFSIGLSPSSGSTTGAGTLSSTSSSGNKDKVPYQLNQTSATGPVWGNTAAAPKDPGNSVASTGTGLAQSFTA